MEQALFPPESVVVNGQSGDFLFGGHIPSEWSEACTSDQVKHYILSKHCSHWHLPYLDQRKNEINQQVNSALEKALRDQHHVSSNENCLMSFYEHWEWQERQPKVPASNQRLYEFFNFAWNLPLWDAALIDFWSRQSFDLKINQFLHIKYLKKYNFRNVFDYGRAPQFAFTGPRVMTIPMANLIGLIGGRSLKQQYYEKMFYRTYFHPQLGLFGKEVYQHTYKETRRPRVVAIAARFRLDELSILGLPQTLLPYV